MGERNAFCTLLLDLTSGLEFTTGITYCMLKKLLEIEFASKHPLCYIQLHIHEKFMPVVCRFLY
jgi:hypothetical protein